MCAKLAKLGVLATPFAGNIPEFDIVAIDAEGRAVQIQVKAASKDGWFYEYDKYVRTIETLEGQHTVEAADPLSGPDIIFVCVLLDLNGQTDRFFVLKHADLQRQIVAGLTAWMAKGHNSVGSQWRYHLDDIKDYEEQWGAVMVLPERT